MASNSRNYEVLTNDQRGILTHFYNNGMNTTEKNMREVMLKAAEQAGASYEKVKVKISLAKYCSLFASFNTLPVNSERGRMIKCLQNANEVLIFIYVLI